MPPDDYWSDPRSTAEVVAATLANPDRGRDTTDAGHYWSNVAILGHRASRTEFEAGVRLCASACVVEQRLGCDVLARLGDPDHPFREESFEPLRSVLDRTSDPVTAACVLFNLGRLLDPRGAGVLLDYRNHPADDCRAAVAWGLPHFPDDPRVAAALIELCLDWDVETRDWATFGLAMLTEQDSPAGRDALVARTEDDIAEIRGEALRGLAERGDERTLAALEREVRRPRIHELAIEAAVTLNDPRCRGLLIRLRERFADWLYLDEAIAKFEPSR